MAEFVGYWQSQLEKVIDQYDGTPVPFGRTKEDPGRIGHRRGPSCAVRQLMAQVHGEIQVTRLPADAER